MSENNNDDADLKQEENKYIIFRLKDELYGSKLLDVREVVENLPTKKIPNAIAAFQGICNLRGQIIGVIDLRIKLSIEIQKDSEKKPVMMVFESPSGSIGAIVDQIISVVEILEQDIERKPNIVCSVPSQYIQGVGKYKDILVTLIDVKNILSQKEFNDINTISQKREEL